VASPRFKLSLPSCRTLGFDSQCTVHFFTMLNNNKWTDDFSTTLHIFFLCGNKPMLFKERHPCHSLRVMPTSIISGLLPFQIHNLLTFKVRTGTSSLPCFLSILPLGSMLQSLKTQLELLRRN
jgi:hypothetical protein